MFWLFRRKKVADKKTITPCVCDSGVERDDSYDMHEFTTSECSRGALRSTSEGALSRLTLGTNNNSDNRGTKKGYQRLQGEAQIQAEAAPSTSTSQQPQEKSVPCHSPAQSSTAEARVPPLTVLDEESTSTSTDYSDDDGGFTSDSYDDEELTCNVCDRSFYSVRHLLQHQQKKRHYGCSVCDSIFQNLMALELHKETLDHWSEDEELRFHETDTDDEEDDYYDCLYRRVPQELERLL